MRRLWEWWFVYATLAATDLGKPGGKEQCYLIIKKGEWGLEIKEKKTTKPKLIFSLTVSGKMKKIIIILPTILALSRGTNFLGELNEQEGWILWIPTLTEILHSI